MKTQRYDKAVELPFHDSTSLQPSSSDQGGTSSLVVPFAARGSDTRSQDEPSLAGSVKFYIDPTKPVAVEDWNVLKE